MVAALQVWVLWQAAAIDPAALSSFRGPRVVAAIFVTTLAISGGVAGRLMPSAVYPGGDEPHYLVIAQSLWRDGDLDIFNNHQRGDYRVFQCRAGAPLQVGEVELPPAVAGVIPLTVTTTNGARPSDRDPASRDSRLLGIWVEIRP